MKIAIQRRTIYLCPAQGMDRAWVARQFDTPEVYEMFGLPGPSSALFRAALKVSNLVVGIMRRSSDDARLGFAVVFAPNTLMPEWEYALAIPDPRDRDAYSALHTMDIIGHYMIDRMGVPSVAGRTRTDNRAANAIPRRAGYEKVETRRLGEHDYDFYRLTPEGWARRRRKLEAGEREHPSGTGGVFRVLDGPPYSARSGTP